MEKLKNKIVNFTSNCKKKIAVMGSTISALVVSAVPCFASETATTVTNASITEELTGFASNLSSLVSFGDIIGIVGIGLGITFTIALGWWGARKLGSMIKNAIFKGKVNM